MSPRLLKYATLKNIIQNVLNYNLSKISLIFFIVFTFLGYYPNFGIPPVKKSYVSANTQEQKGEIIPNSFPQPIILPHSGYLSTRSSSWHPGIDIAAGLGMPIRPITAGVVKEVSTDFFGLGHFVVISHEKGYQSKYAHLGKIYAKVGEKVTSENIIGEVGLTGQTSGPHTHLEITLDGKYINPQTILPEISAMPASLSLQRGEPKIAATK